MYEWLRRNLDNYVVIVWSRWSKCGQAVRGVVNVLKKEGAEGLTHGSFLNVVQHGSHDLTQAPALLRCFNDDFDLALLADHIWLAVSHTDYYSLHVYEHLSNVYLYQADWSARYTTSWLRLRN
jgi:sulfur transfer complex TusBCD TusB component (DsrH family)